MRGAPVRGERRARARQVAWALCLSAPLALGVGLLAACSDSSSNNGGESTAVNPATLCLAASCGTKDPILDIPSAENMLFSPDGRFFVSGGENVYEITHPAAGWTATPLSPTACNFTGLALRGNLLYANCFDGQLYAARIDVPAPSFAAIHDMGLGAPNGLVAGPSGELYVVNGPLATSALPDPKIVRLKFGGDPMVVTDQSDWLALPAFVDFPNGIQRDGNTLYFSQSSTLPVSLGAIKKVQIQADGSPGPVIAFAALPNLPDDFTLSFGYAVVALYASSQIALIDPSGATLATSSLLSFNNPSSVKLGRPPLFAPGDIIVTEKGVIGLPPTPGYGNVLSVFRRNPP